MLQRRSGFTGLLAVVLFSTAVLFAQGQARTDKVKDLKLKSSLMGREMPYRVILPDGYSASKDRYAVVYLLHGLTGHFDDWANDTDLVKYSSAHKFIIVTPEANDGWYTDSVTTPKDKFESYIVTELIPEIDKDFRTMADRPHRVIAGLSMGGYGSMKFGLKYPKMFVLAGSFSGAVSAASFTQANAGEIGKSIEGIFGAPGSETRDANDIFKTVKSLTEIGIKDLPFIYVSCGTEDFLFSSNRDFDQVLIDKKIPHEYREHPGKHDWKFWNAQVKEFLEVADSFTSQPSK